MKAIVCQDVGGPIILSTSRSRPALRPTYILVRTHAVALNPADNLYVEYKMAGQGSLLGCDYAGVVLEVGAEVRKDLKPGDRVCGCTRAGDADQIENGTFAEVICVKGDLAVRIPKGMSYEDASTTGVTMLTTGICLYQKGNLAFPKLLNGSVEDVCKKRVIFIYGGSSAMGTMLIQFAKLSGFEVWTCASRKNFDLVKSYGAHKVWDYTDSTAAESIRIAAEKTAGIKLCVDCIGEPPTSAFCATFLAPGATYSAISPFSKVDREDVTNVVTMGYSFLGEKWKTFDGNYIEANPKDLLMSAEFATVCEELLAAGLIKPHPVHLKAGGLESVIEGLQDLKKISGQKIVIKVP